MSGIRTTKGRVATASVAVAAMVLAVTAAWGASARMNAYFAPDFTDTAYQRKAVDKVIKAWKPPAPFPSVGKKTVVISRIGRDGALLGTSFNLTSGSEGWDEAAKTAVEKAGFDPLPKGYPRPTVEVHWHFEVGK